LDKDLKDKAIEQSFIATQEGFGKTLDFNKYKEYLVGWIVHPIEYKQEIVGAVFSKDNELHIGVNGMWYPRRYIKNIIIPLFDSYDEVIITVDNYNSKGLKWVMKLGWKIIKTSTIKTTLSLKKEYVWVS